jgi:hypothetical protein
LSFPSIREHMDLKDTIDIGLLYNPEWGISPIDFMFSIKFKSLLTIL